MFKLEFETGTDAFNGRESGDWYPQPEAARVLRAVLHDMREGALGGPVRDANGNTVGRWSLTEED